MLFLSLSLFTLGAAILSFEFMLRSLMVLLYHKDMDKESPPLRLEDDQKERISLLIEHRVPWLFVGLIGGIAAAIFASQFEEVFARNLSLAYFIPVIVYMADAVGHQTEEVYIRNMGKEKIHFAKYLVKEILLGLALGI